MNAKVLLGMLCAVYATLAVVLFPVAGTTAAGVMKSHCGDFVLSGPQTHENLTIFLIHGEDKIKSQTILPLEEALIAKKAIVHETGDVNRLEVENIANDADVFIQSGDMVKGGKQDRLIAFDLLLPPNSGRVSVVAFCVNQSRWQQRGKEAVAKFGSSSAQLPSKSLKLLGGQYGQLGGRLSQDGQVGQIGQVGAQVGQPGFNAQGNVNLGVGRGPLGFGGGQLGQLGNLGGQFGLQGGNQSQLLITLNRQVVGKPKAWATAYDPITGQPPNPLDDAATGQPLNPLDNGGGQLGQLGNLGGQFGFQGGFGGQLGQLGGQFGIQGGVWTEVAAVQRKLRMNSGAKESDSSLQLTLEDKNVQEAVDKYVRKLSPALDGQKDVIGFAFAINGKVNSADVYASSTLFKKMWPKLLKTSATEALTEFQKGNNFPSVTVKDVEPCLVDAEKGKMVEKNVSNRIQARMHETDKNILLETLDRQRKGTW